MIKEIININLDKLDFFQRVCRFNSAAGTKLGREKISHEEADNEVDMLREEVDELNQAVCVDRIGTADALADIIYVAMGTMAKLGFDYYKVMDEVCKSNESKFQNGSLVKNENGKIQKGTDFKEPDLSFCEKVDPLFIVPEREYESLGTWWDMP